MLVWPNIRETDSIGTPLLSVRRGEGVTGHVEGDVLLDAARDGYLLQILVHLLVGHRGEELALALGIVLILLDDALGTIEEDDAGRSGGFLTCNLYPLSAIERDNILRS